MAAFPLKKSSPTFCNSGKFSSVKTVLKNRKLFPTCCNLGKFSSFNAVLFIRKSSPTWCKYWFSYFIIWLSLSTPITAGFSLLLKYIFITLPSFSDFSTSIFSMSCKPSGNEFQRSPLSAKFIFLFLKSM